MKQHLQELCKEVLHHTVSSSTFEHPRTIVIYLYEHYTIKCGKHSNDKVARSDQTFENAKSTSRSNIDVNLKASGV